MLRSEGLAKSFHRYVQRSDGVCLCSSADGSEKCARLAYMSGVFAYFDLKRLHIELASGK